MANERERRSEKRTAKEAASAPTSGGGPLSERRRFRRYLLVCVLLFCPLFLHSCDNSTIKTSLGPAAPTVVVVLDGDDMWPQGIERFDPLALLANVGVLIGLVWLYQLPKARRFMTSRLFVVTLIGFVGVSDLVLLGRFIPPLLPVYSYLIFWPVINVAGVFEPAVERLVLLTPIAPLNSAGNARTQTIAFGIASRLYLVLVVAGVPLVASLLRRLARRLRPDPDRWWQLSVRAWFVLTLILGLLLVLLIAAFR